MIRVSIRGIFAFFLMLVSNQQKRSDNMSTQFRTHVSPNVTTHLLRQMLVVNNQPMTIVKPLIDRAELVKSSSAVKGIALSILGSAPLFDGAKLATRTKPNWALYNLSYDPLWQNGKFPIPVKHLRRLNTLYRGGVEFDALYVAHELPMDFQPDHDRLELRLVEPPPPATAMRLAHGLGFATDSILRAYAAAIRKPIKALAVASTTGFAVLRDPVLMGAVIPPGINPEPGVPAIWFLLAAWRW